MDPNLTVLWVLSNVKFIWRLEECTAGAVYLSRILWLDKELLEKLCNLAFLVYWLAVRKNRCLLQTHVVTFLIELDDY